MAMVLFQHHPLDTSWDHPVISFNSIYPFIIYIAGLFPTDTEICELINFLDGNDQGEVQFGELSMAMMQQVIN